MERVLLNPINLLSLSFPVVTEGSVWVVFAKKDHINVKFVESNKNNFSIYTKPHWIECGLVENGLFNNLSLINAHLDEIVHLEAINEYECVRNKNLVKEDFDYIESGARRIINILYRKLMNDKFFEVNLTGLSDLSLNSLFDYILDVNDKNPLVTCLLIQYVEEEFLYLPEYKSSTMLNKYNKKDILSYIDFYYSYVWRT